MPTKVTIEFMGHMVTGESEFCGPDEVEYTEILCVTPENDDPQFRSDAIFAVESEAYKKYRRGWSDFVDHGDYEYEDAYTDYCSSRGGDYWIDPESGEPRCG